MDEESVAASVASSEAPLRATQQLATISATGWLSIEYGNGSFVLAGDSPGEELIVIDAVTGAVTNVSDTVPGGESLNDIEYANGHFVTMSAIGSTSAQIFIAEGDGTCLFVNFTGTACTPRCRRR